MFRPVKPPHEFWDTNESAEMCLLHDTDTSFRNEVNALRSELAYFYDDDPIDWAHAAMRIAWESRQMMNGISQCRSLKRRV